MRTPSGLFALCAMLFFSLCDCDSVTKEDELELKGEAKLAGDEETTADKGEDKNVTAARFGME